MRYEILGTIIVVLLATIIGLPTGLMAGIFLAEFGGQKMTTAIRFIADVLTGLPSIVIGVFVYAIVVRNMRSFSAFAGGISLAIIMIPIIARTSEESLRLVPHSLREASLALGVSRWRTVLSVVIPGARTGIITGGLLATARITGETAPLLFTSPYSLGHYFYQGVFKSVQTLPTGIFNKATSPYATDREQAWAASVILVLMVLIISIFVRWLASRGRAR
jgi:phosphate transport system permease protein